MDRREIRGSRMRNWLALLLMAAAAIAAGRTQAQGVEYRRECCGNARALTAGVIAATGM